MKLLRSSFIIALVTIGYTTMAQLPGGLPGGGGGIGTTDPETAVPIDNGIFLLVAAGLILGIRKLIKAK